MKAAIYVVAQDRLQKIQTRMDDLSGKISVAAEKANRANAEVAKARFNKEAATREIDKANYAVEQLARQRYELAEEIELGQQESVKLETEISELRRSEEERLKRKSENANKTSELQASLTDKEYELEQLRRNISHKQIKFSEMREKEVRLDRK